MAKQAQTHTENDTKPATATLEEQLAAKTVSQMKGVGTTIPMSPAKPNGATTSAPMKSSVPKSLNLARPKAPVTVDDEVVALIRDAKVQIPEVVGGKQGWATTLLTIITLHDTDARAQQAPLEAEARAELARYAAGDLGDWLNSAQKADLGQIAQISMMNKFAEQAPSEFGILLDIMRIGANTGAIRRKSYDDNLERLQGRVIYAGKATYISNLSIEASTPWVAQLNEKWEEVSRRNWVDHKAAEKALNQKATSTVAEMLGGSAGICAVTVPDSWYVDKKKERRFSAGGVLLVESDGEVVWPIGAVGKLTKRFEDIIDPANERGFRLSYQGEARNRPVRRGFKDEHLKVLDPRQYSGTKEEVLAQVAKNEMPLSAYKQADGESEKDRLQRIGDNKRLWGALVLGIPKTLAKEEERKALTKKGDVDACAFFSGDKPVRVVICIDGVWHEEKEDHNDPTFAAKRDKDGGLSFEWPIRLDALYVGVERGKAYGKDDLPAVLARQMAKARRTALEDSDSASGDETKTGAGV